MIYLDNAATTLQKPDEVGQSMQTALHTCASHARSGHAPALRAGELVYRCRARAAALFDLPAPDRVIFTYNATHALNLAIHALCTGRTRPAVSGYEHNAVMRPLYARGLQPIVLHSRLFDQADFLNHAEQAIRQGADLFIINHVSNVFGSIVPLKDLDALLYSKGIPLILDASQSAGIVPVSVRGLHALAAVCMPGHKGLMGPQGTGLLLCCTDQYGAALIQGGTGSLSAAREMPPMLPDHFESGTLNVPGIAGLYAGLEFLQRTGVQAVGARERALGRALIRRLRAIDGLEVFSADDPLLQTGLVSIRSTRISCETMAARLDEAGICVRAGLHCAPCAHETAGTLETGTVRLAPGWYNTQEEIAYTAQIIEEIMSNL